MIDFWYREAVLYELDVKVFQDSNGDGFGDFTGLTRRLPHIAGLGATCIWLRPIHPSPLRDDGYDVTDYYAVDPRLGTPGDLVVFLREAYERGLRVITDLVVNHSSDRHPWFRSARRAEDSPFRNYYVWSREKPADSVGPVFPGPQQRTWTYDEAAGAYYHHRFFSFQPDLNTAHPEVRKEVGKVMSYWLRLGLSGFRVDAAPFLVEHLPGLEDGAVTPFVNVGEADVERPYGLLREMRRALSWCQGDAILMAEANVPAAHVPEYFGPSGDRMHMLFNFALNQRLMLALARRQAAPLAEHLRNPPQVPHGGQWVNFLRTHDELDLSGLSDRERQDVFAAFGPAEDMQIYGRGLRRRLAPMLGGDARRVELAHSLLLTLPGTPLIRYGDEIGMGEDLSLPDRLAVRTPMQWSDEPNAGFSAAPPDRLIRPVISGGEFGYERVNAATQRDDRDGLLSRISRLVQVRKGCSEFAHGELTVLDAGDPAVFAHRCEAADGAVIAVHNLADRPTRAAVETGPGEQRKDLLGDTRAATGDADGAVELPPFGYRWFRVVGGQFHGR